MKNPLSNNILVQISGLSFSYSDKKNLLNNLNLNVDAGGEITCLLGPSGSGKSTLLKLLLNEFSPDKGEATVSTDYLTIYQDYERMIMPWFKVNKNILYGLNNFDNSLIEEVINMLEISDLLNAYPFELSGGEKQRVVFARMLVRLPKLIIVDEPLSSIDIGLSSRIIPAIKKFLKSKKISALWVTHNVIESVKLADSVWVINAKGYLIQIFTNNNISLQEKALLIQESML